MKTDNSGVIGTDTNWTNARGDRDEEMYADGTGLVDIALAVKKYVKAAFGGDSPEYNQIKGLEFTRP